MEEQVAFLSRGDILGTNDLEVEQVFIPEWNGYVMVRALTGEERDQFEAEIIQQRGTNIERNLRNIRAKLVALSVVDADGNRLFTTEDVEQLGKKNAKALDRIFTVAQRLSGLTAEDVDTLAKN